MTWTKEQQKEYMKNRHQEHPEFHRNYVHEWRAARRYKCIMLLGGKCVRCGFSDIRALQIDHIKGGAYKERKAGISTISTSDRYPQIIQFLKENPQQTKYQLLCANCNWIKKDENME